MREITSFTEFFIICTATNSRQAQTVCDEIGKQMKQTGRLPISVEGYERAEWVLIDYGEFIVHVFSESARGFYDLERLWRHARLVEPVMAQNR